MTGLVTKKYCGTGCRQGAYRERKMKEDCAAGVMPKKKIARPAPKSDMEKPWGKPGEKDTPCTS